MDKKKIINKVMITTDAEFDYESEFKCRLQKLQLKQEIEDYISIRLKNFNGYYFRVKFYDEFANEMLILFVYKGDTFGCMQISSQYNLYSNVSIALPKAALLSAICFPVIS